MNTSDFLVGERVIYRWMGQTGMGQVLSPLETQRGGEVRIKPDGSPSVLFVPEAGVTLTLGALEARRQGRRACA